MLRHPLLAALILLAADSARAAIAPECVGVVKAPGYDEEQQQAWLQNYYAAQFLMTSLGPVIPYAGSRAGVGVEVGLVPPVSCERRLVLDGTKTEQTNALLVHPRPRLTATLPDLGPVSTMIGFTVLPPVPTPWGTVLEAGVETGIGWRAPFGLVVGGRAHLAFGRVRTELSTPLDLSAPRVDDLFYSSVLGAEVGAGWEWRPHDVVAVAPYLNAGIADVSTLFVVGDDRTVVENTRHPWAGATGALGVQTLLFDHVELVVEASAALPMLATVKTKIGVVW